ncbi:hypothetical protein JUM41_06380 [Rhizobium pusense]|uniref:hypothetical protein n=1 Tax=Agrobacterium pusense TaxID=648995 RepID=UPI001FCC0D7E|nr:hypothetical protein [Agrobacterium pusense]MCJ2873857.1 hypothetical protein [Agrobacterium pusense]
MKTSSIRIRIEHAEKAKIEAFSNRTGTTVSEILRQAAASAVSGDVPGANQRMKCTAIRRSANNLLAILAEKPIQFETLRAAVVDIRTAAHELVQCR